MDGIPVQIINIEKDVNQKTIYNLRYDSLYECLSQVNDKEVAVLSISGPSRQGKSFLLSYLLRFLLNPNDNNWIGREDTPLKGFEWNHGIEPETKGIWLWSKPIVFKNGMGKEIAVIVMDTQGVYDEYTDLRDWSTIVGITLLTSSCFIYNVFTDIQEMVLTQLETFVNYGLLAMSKDDNKTHAFQRLLFLIRDWNHARDFGYGHKGGKEYIAQKLSKKSSQPQASQRTRELIRNCFEDVTCFLMPEIGGKKDEPDFDGSVSQLNPRFTAKLRELFAVLLNPESLKPKVINGNTINGRELIKYFEVFVEKFNGDQLPQPMDLVEAVAKATDLNLIYKLKEKFYSEMRKILQTKHFFSRYELEIVNNSVRTELSKLFQTLKKSQNYDIVRKINQTFETEFRNEYKKIYLGNEEQRDKTANDTIDNCINIYYKSMDQLMKENNFVKSDILDTHSKECKKNAMEYYRQIFGEEEIDSYAPYLLRILRTIEETEHSFRALNNEHKSESKKANTLLIDNCFAHYCNQIKSLIEGNVFLTHEKFNECEQQIRAQTLKLLANKCVGDEKNVKKFEDLLTFKLFVTKSEFETLNNYQMNETIKNTEKQLNSALIYFDEKLAEILEFFTGAEDLDQSYETIQKTAIDMFKNNCIVKESDFMSPHIQRLELKMETSNKKFVNDYKSKSQHLNDFYNQCVEEAIDRCFVKIEGLFEGKRLISMEELINFRDKLINDVMNNYKNVTKNGKFDEIKDHINKEISSAADLLLIHKLTELYSNQMNTVLNTKKFFPREEILQIHNENYENVIFIFNNNKKSVVYQIVNQLTVQLNDSLKAIYDKYYSQNEKNREQNTEEEILNIFSQYKQIMSQTLNEVCVEPQKFDEINRNSQRKAFKQLNDFCGDEKELIDSYTMKLRNMIENVENELKMINDYNISEAKKRNLEASENAIEYYTNKMNSALNENLFYSKQHFNQYENNVREEANKKFTEECIYGEIDFRNKFELEFVNSIKLLKTKLKTKFSKNMADLEKQTINLIHKCLEKYNEFMYHLVDNLKNEQMFKSKHEDLKTSAIKKFKLKCMLKESDYRDQQISKLENAIEDSRNQFHERFLSKIKKSGDFYEKSINQSFNNYAELMRNIFSDDVSLPEEELKNLHYNVLKDIMSSFEKNFVDEEDLSVIESNRRTLELKIMAEFESIKNTNRMRNDSIEKAVMELKLKIKDYVEEYEERMDKTMPFCGSEEELLGHHFEIQDIIKEKMLKSSPYKNAKLFEPFVTQLEVEISKSLKDFNVIFKVNSDKQLLCLQNVIMNARKFYRQEMDKYYSETNFLSSQNLNNNNIAVTERTIAKYGSERGNMSFDKFSILIKDSLQDIYNDIVIENNKNTPTLPSIGIDLGTTNCCVAYYHPSKPKGVTNIVPNGLGGRTTPSVVSFGKNNEEVIGEAAKEQSYMNSRNTIYSAKRLIGRQFDDETVQKDMLLWPFRVVDDGNNIAKICVKVDGNDKHFFPEEISAKILKNLKQTAERHLGCEVKNAVITVPAYFSDAQKEATIDAGKIAGLNVLKIINEPTAAAIAFQLNRSDDKDLRKVLIFDFGGGTMDVVVLAIEKGVIDIKAVGGDNHLGGDDIDAILVDNILSEFIIKEKIVFDRNSEEGENALRRLTTECEKRKRQLCATNTVQISVDNFFGGKDLRCDLTRQQFEELCNDLFVKSTDLVAQVLSDSHFEHSDIDDVVLVGGTTRIPKIQEMLSDLFYGKPLNHSVNPDEAVAIGAAIQAAIINGSLAQDAGLLRVSDVTPMSLGVKVKNGFMSVIIHRNSKVPNKYTKRYQTVSDNQYEVEIEIYEGEEVMAEDNRKLGTFTVSNIPPGIAGEQEIEVTFNINDEGILHVTAKIMSNGVEEEIQITEHKARLTNEELQQLIEQVFKEEEENKNKVKVDLHEGYGLFWTMASNDSKRVKALVQKQKELRAENMRHKIVYSYCRFCGISCSTQLLTIGYVCSESECEEYAKNACIKTLKCGHECGGIYNENKCLPCLQGCCEQLKQNGEDMCMICLSESLSRAPTIQLKCGHLFHEHCCKAVLINRWPGPRITFTFSVCPICKTNIEHISLEELLRPIRNLYEDVNRKALMRLEYEGLHRCEAITIPGGRFYLDGTAYAMERYAYYVCFKCNKAYYGGEARCDAELGIGDNYDAQQLVCGACSDVSHTQMCPKHGSDFLEYKCRYCCSIAVWFCFGTTHFCNICHNNHQNLTKLSQFAKCPVGPNGQQLVGDECPLHVKHPQTGQEFALGCGVCINALTF